MAESVQTVTPHLVVSDGIIPRHPAEGRDPYAEPSRFGNETKAFRNH
jgi:hypothetical protein